MKLLAVPPREEHHYYVQVMPLRQKFETHCKLFVPNPKTFAYYSGAFCNEEQSFCRLLCKTAIIAFTVLSFVYFTQAEKFGVTDYFLPSQYCASQNEGHLCADEEVLFLLSFKMNANILQWNLLTSNNDCELDLWPRYWRLNLRVRLIG